MILNSLRRRSGIAALPALFLTTTTATLLASSTLSPPSVCTMTTSTSTAEEVNHWEKSWETGVAPGTRWDIGKAEPELVYEITQGMLQSSKGAKALVPGCGRGYAVKALAEAGYFATGLELSKTATEVANKEQPHERAKYVVGDFFEHEDQYDVIFDSTFLCAIPPTKRTEWAMKMNQIVKKDGHLALQVFPVFEEAPEISLDGPFGEGPPYRLTLNLVRELLKPYPFEEVLLRKTPPERAARGGSEVRGTKVVEYFMVWQRK